MENKKLIDVHRPFELEYFYTTYKVKDNAKWHSIMLQFPFHNSTSWVALMLQSSGFAIFWDVSQICKIFVMPKNLSHLTHRLFSCTSPELKFGPRTKPLEQDENKQQNKALV